jgi:hypothetical protein
MAEFANWNRTMVTSPETSFVILPTLSPVMDGLPPSFRRSLGRSLREHPMRQTLLILVTTVLSAGCNPHDNVQCASNLDCNLTAGGVCLMAPPSGHQWCAYPDSGCTSGYRYSNDDVGDGVGGTCVADGNGTLYTLTISVGGNGTGSIASMPTGLACADSTCTGKFQAGTQVQLTATATSGSFLGWSNGCNGTGPCVLKMDVDRGVGALFGTPGKALWLRDVGGAASSGSAKKLVIDGQGNIVVVGVFSGSIQLGTKTLTSAGKGDLFVAKLSGSTGDVIWAKQFGGTDEDAGSDVAVDPADSIYIVGQYQSPSIDFGGGALSSIGFRGGFLVKLDPNGSHVWSKNFGSNASSSDSASVTGVSVNATGVAATGSFTGSLTANGTTLTSAGNTDVLVAKFATDGTKAWIRSFGESMYDFGNDVAIDSSGNVVVVGSFQGSLMVPPNGTLEAGSVQAVLLLKLASADGSPLVSKRFGSTTMESNGLAVAIDNSDAIFIGGGFWGTGDFGGGAPLMATRVQDAFLAKYSSAGAYLWAKSFGGTGDGESIVTVSLNAGGDVAATGGFCGTLSFGGDMLSAASQCPSSGVVNHGNDMFAAHFSGTDGSHVVSFRGGGALDDDGIGIALAADGRLFVSGIFQSFAEFGGSTLTAQAASTSADGFILSLPPR